MVLVGCSGGALANARVNITKTDFEPANVVVKAGGTVTWTNNDTIPHTVTAADNLAYDSGAIYPGKTFTQHYDTVGTYGYYCRFITTLKGTVTVK
jgi:plastocyanin